VQLYSVRDLLRTAIEHISHQVARAVSTHSSVLNERREAAADSRRPLRLLATGSKALIVSRVVESNPNV